MEIAIITTKILNMFKVVHNESNPYTTFNEMLILMCIKKNNLTKTEINKILLNDKATTSRSVDKILKKGMIERVENTFKYTLTQKGVEVTKEVSKNLNFLLIDNFKGLSKEVDTTLENLKILTKELEAYYE